MNIHISKIADAFRKDMAHRYSLPELLDLQFEEAVENSIIANRYGESALFAGGDVQPTGQLSAIVRKLSVTIVVREDSEVKNLYHGFLKFAYDHHNGGSNGKDTDFLIAAETHFGNSDVVYQSAIEKTAFNTIHFEILRHREERRAQKQ